MRRANPSVKHYRSVVQLTLISWWNQLLLDLGGFRLYRGLLVGGVTALLSLWAIFGILSSLTQPVAQTPEVELVEVLGLQLMVLALLLGPLVMAILLIFAPPRSRLIDMMTPLPVTRRAINLGTELPLMVIAFVALMAVLIPIAGSSLRLMSPEMAWVSIGLLLLFGSLGVSLGWLVFRLVCWVGTKALRVPLALSRSLAGLANVALAVAGISALDLGSVTTAPAMVSFIPLDFQDSNEMLLLGLTFVSFLVLLGVVIYSGAAVPDPSESGSSQSVPWGRRLQVGTRKPLLRAEALQWLRHPLVISTEIMMVLTVVACVVFIPAETMAWEILSHLLLIASTAGSGVFGWGLNRDTQWTHIVNGASIRQLFWSKLTVSAAISSILFILCWGLISLNSPLPAQSLLVLIPLCLTGFCAAFFAGIIFPVDQEQSLSSAMALLGTLLITIALGVGLSQLDMLPHILRGGIVILIALTIIIMARNYALALTNQTKSVAG